MRICEQSCKLLWRYTKGIPRLINKMMSRALLIAYARQQAIDPRVIKEAADSLHLGKRIVPVWWFPKPGWLFAVTAVFVLTISGILLSRVGGGFLWDLLN
jgi:hypothetical protein